MVRTTKCDGHQNVTDNKDGHETTCKNKFMNSQLTKTKYKNLNHNKTGKHSTDNKTNINILMTTQPTYMTVKQAQRHVKAGV